MKQKRLELNSGPSCIKGIILIELIGIGFKIKFVIISDGDCDWSLK